MKKLFILLFALGSQLFSAQAQYVTIPDANFANRLSVLFPTCMSGNQMDTTCAQIINATILNVGTSTIYDLTGIEYFDNLLTLDCDSNYLTSLPPLPPSLQILYCSVNQLTSLPALPNSLQQLHCNYNQLSNLPTMSSSLWVLNCGYNQITVLPTLPSSLVNLSCIHNQIDQIPNLPNNLATLSCSYNSIDTFPPLPNTLLAFVCDYNGITTLPALPNNLATLNCSSNTINNLPALPNTLVGLNCSWNQIAVLPTLPSTIQSLHCASNLLTSLPLLPSSLTSLVCFSNQLTTLPILPATLQTLNAGNNQLTSLPSVPNIMTYFWIANNSISCLESLPIVPDSSSGSISNNPLTCIPNQTSYSLGLPFCIDNDSVSNPNNCPNVNIVGNVYTDLNNNCTHENSDLPTENIPVKLYDSQNNLVAISYTVNGVYSFGSLQPDTFQVKIEDNILPVSMACGQLNYQSVTLDFANQTQSGIDFVVMCNEFDLNIQSVSRLGMVFPGQIHRLFTNITNNETWYNLNCNSSSYSGTVTIEITGPVNYFSTPPNALIPQINGNIFTYNILDFNSITASSFALNFMTDTTAQVSDLICAHVILSTTPIDNDTTNNVYDYCYNVINSYDPNMKEVYPVDVLPGYDDWFTYTIHFQNTGNAPAFNIRLRDTLDTNLDVNTFEILGYSHAANTTISGGVLTVRFNNIMLPDSTTDYEGSMGYFQYRLKPLPNLPNGTQIENTAYIYFDYNAPIITNTTQNNFDITVGQLEPVTGKNEFVLYPNPSNGVFNFKDTKNVKQVEVYNLLGEQIVTQGQQKQINLSAFAKGIYFARINGEVVVKLVKE